MNAPARSWSDPRVEVRPSPLGGHGTIARAPIAAGEPVFRWGGALFTPAEIRAGTARPGTVAPIDEGLYLASPADADADPSATARKARRAGLPLASGSGRRLTLAVAPAFGACAPLTVALAAGRFDLLPGLWLLLYGSDVVAGGAVSVPVVPLMGGSAMLLGTAALATPPAWGDAWMALGFGGLHLGFGAVIARRYGG